MRVATDQSEPDGPAFSLLRIFMSSSPGVKPAARIAQLDLQAR
jgi:hypothetical protein